VRYALLRRWGSVAALRERRPASKSTTTPPNAPLRTVALGRKNYLFAGFPMLEARRAAARSYSLIGTAKLNGLDPGVLLAQRACPASPTIPSTASRKLLPWNLRGRNPPWASTSAALNNPCRLSTTVRFGRLRSFDLDDPASSDLRPELHPAASLAISSFKCSNLVCHVTINCSCWDRISAFPVQLGIKLIEIGKSVMCGKPIARES